MQSAIERTFEAGTWVVAKMSFGKRIIKMQVDGEYCNIIKPLTELDFETIKVSIWEGSNHVFDGLRKDFTGDHSIFPTF